MKKTESEKGVLVVEAHHAFRQALAYLLGREPDLEVAAQAEALPEGWDDELGRADIAVVGLGSSSATGSIQRLRERAPDVPLLALTVESGELQRRRALEAGADEVLAKSASLDEVFSAIRDLDNRRAALAGFARSNVRERSAKDALHDE